MINKDIYLSTEKLSYNWFSKNIRKISTKKPKFSQIRTWRAGLWVKKHQDQPGYRWKLSKFCLFLHSLASRQNNNNDNQSSNSFWWWLFLEISSDWNKHCGGKNKLKLKFTVRERSEEIQRKKLSLFSSFQVQDFSSKL